VWVSAVVVAATLAIGAVPTWSAFSSTTANPGNTFSAGTVILSDNDSGGAMLSLGNLAPGGPIGSSCIEVAYDGSLDAQVRLYGATTGTGLDPWLNLTVTHGVLAGGAFPSCAQFTADAADYTGLGAGVVYTGTLQDLADNHATALDDPQPAARETWTTGEHHAYKITVGLDAAAPSSAAGLTATQAFTWEARDLGFYTTGAWQHPWGSSLNHDQAQDGYDGQATVIAGVPWITWAEDDGTGTQIRVAKLNAAGTAWTEVVGGASPINHDPSQPADNPSLASIGGVPYVTWDEYDGVNREIRVAKLNGPGTAWTEVAGGASPINHDPVRSAVHPSLTDVAGVPYVAWEETGASGNQVRVAKLNGAGTAWAEVASGGAPLNVDAAMRAYDPSIMTLAGVPYVAWSERDAIESNYEIRVAKLNATGDGWVQVGGGASPVNHAADTDGQTPSLAVVESTLYVAWTEGDWDSRKLRVAKLNGAGTAWTEVVGGTSPINHTASQHAEAPSLAAVGGVPYVAWREYDGANYEVRVARLSGDGTAWTEIVGGASPINDDPGRRGDTPSLVGVGGSPMVVWFETDQSNNYQVKVARP
jgi:hypothetical protein